MSFLDRNYEILIIILAFLLCGFLVGSMGRVYQVKQTTEEYNKCLTIGAEPEQCEYILGIIN